ncbi:MAG: PAS domain S-box protein [Bdellovibrionales bacterium]|nr:PAS domain S-box protein [Bdellovibrionales bacterium]
MKSLGFADVDDVYYRCVEDCNEAIMISDFGGRLVYVNPAWTRAYGFSREEAVGQTSRILRSGHQSKEFYAGVWKQILDPAVGHWRGEIVNKAKDGSLVPVLLTITPVRSPEKEIRGFMGIAVDLRAMKEMEAQIAHQDRLASIGTLASGLAHEIGTPLGVVRGRAEFLMMKINDPEARRELEVITAQADRISKLIRSLLRVSRGFSDAVVGDVSVLDVAQEVISLVGQHFRKEDAEIAIEVPADFVLRADHSRLEQVFLNLAMNALHAIQKAKQDGRAGPHRLRIRAERAEGGARIRVEDTGCGISAENQRHLFKPFFTTKDVGQGTGLGLAIVAQLLSEMGGRVSVESTVDVGTAFVLAFPPQSLVG